MGIDLRIEDESGRELAALLDPQGFVQRLLVSCPHGSFTCLRFVDPYGDATFNQLQVPYLLEDLRLAVGATQDAAARHHGELAIQLVEENQDVHTYVKFYGD